MSISDIQFVSRAVLDRRRGPFKLTAALTWVCDQTCKHCSIWARPKSKELTPGEWRQVFRSARKTLSWLDLTGGEVTTRQDFVEIAVAAIEELPRLSMLHFPSNGRKPHRLESIAKGVLSAQPKRLVISLSLDGPPDVHAKIRGDEHGFNNTVESYGRLRRLGIETYFGLTVSPHNLHHIDEAFASLQARVDGFQWSDLHVNILHESPHYFGNVGIETSEPEELERLIHRLVDRRGLPKHPTHLMERLYLQRVGQYLRTGRSPVSCTSLSGNAFIDPTGRLYPCHIWDEPVGKLDQHGFSLPRLWATSRRAALRKDVVNERCPGCWTPCEAYPSILRSLPKSLLPTG